MPLLRLDGVSLAYGHLPLLTRVDFQIERGEQVCLVGRNGAGKSTLLRVLTGAVLPDEGDIWRHDALRIAHLEQEVPPDSGKTIYEVVAAGLGTWVSCSRSTTRRHNRQARGNERRYSGWRSCRGASTL